MFIVSQSRDFLYNLNYMAYIKRQKNHICAADGKELACYETDKRAKEVFEEMIETLSPAIVMQNVEIDEEMMKRIQNTPFVIARDDVKIENVCPIYKMPLE